MARPGSTAQAGKAKCECTAGRPGPASCCPCGGRRTWWRGESRRGIQTSRTAKREEKRDNYNERTRLRATAALGFGIQGGKCWRRVQRSFGPLCKSRRRLHGRLLPDRRVPWIPSAPTLAHTQPQARGTPRRGERGKKCSCLFLVRGRRLIVHFRCKSAHRQTIRPKESAPTTRHIKQETMVYRICVSMRFGHAQMCGRGVMWVEKEEREEKKRKKGKRYVRAKRYVNTGYLIET